MYSNYLSEECSTIYSQDYEINSNINSQIISDDENEFDLITEESDEDIEILNEYNEEINIKEESKEEFEISNKEVFSEDNLMNLINESQDHRVQNSNNISEVEYEMENDEVDDDENDDDEDDDDSIMDTEEISENETLEESSPISKKKLSWQERLHYLKEKSNSTINKVDNNIKVDSDKKNEDNKESIIKKKKSFVFRKNKVKNNIEEEKEELNDGEVEEDDLKIELDTFLSYLLSNSTCSSSSSNSESLPLSLFFNNYIKINLIQVIFDHIIYMNNFIPNPIKMLKLYYEDIKNENKKFNIKLKKLENFLIFYEELFDNLYSILQQSIILNQIFIIFGPSISNPKKSFCINFPSFEEIKNDPYICKSFISDDIADEMYENNMYYNEINKKYDNTKYNEKLKEFLLKLNRIIVRNLIQYDMIIDEKKSLKKYNIFFSINCSLLSTNNNINNIKIPSLFYYKHNFILKNIKKYNKKKNYHINYNKKINFLYNDSNNNSYNQLNQNDFNTNNIINNANQTYWIIQKKGLKSF